MSKLQRKWFHSLQPNMSNLSLLPKWPEMYIKAHGSIDFIEDDSLAKIPEIRSHQDLKSGCWISHCYATTSPLPGA
jgi:hypothetical protein